MSAVHESIADTLRDCAQRIERCHEAPAPQAEQTFDDATTRVIGVRNAWMKSETSPERQATLRRLNALLSLMASIEFPLAGFHRERLDAVTKEMRAISDASGGT